MAQVTEHPAAPIVCVAPPQLSPYILHLHPNMYSLFCEEFSRNALGGGSSTSRSSKQQGPRRV